MTILASLGVSKEDETIRDGEVTEDTSLIKRAPADITQMTA